MEEIETLIWFGGLVLVAIFFAALAVKYVRYWDQLKRAITLSGIEKPFYSQEELNKTARKSFVDGYVLIFDSWGRAVRILFTMRSDNPLVMKPLQGIRRVLVTLLLFPFLLAFIIVAIYAFLVAPS